MTRISVNTYAKLNLSLFIKGMLDNGYHEMDMIIQSIDLFDTITVTLTSNKELTIKSNDDTMPTDDTNIISKCCKAFIDYTKITFSGINVYVDKNIPSGSGLGGGSANGAGTLFALNRIYDTRLSNKELIDIGKNVGADIPFCLIGGTCNVKGYGEEVIPLNIPLQNYYFVVVKCKESIKTKTAFSYINDIELSHSYTTRRMINMIERDNFNEIVNLFHNDFEMIKHESTQKVREHFLNFNENLKPLMTGTGSAIFCMFKTEIEADKCFKHMNKIYKETFLCRPINKGYEKV